jgi:hypothetical protein
MRWSLQPGSIGQPRLAARTLLSGEGEGGLEGFLGWSGIIGIVLEQDFAAQAMQEWVIAAVLNLMREIQGFVDTR